MLLTSCKFLSRINHKWIQNYIEIETERETSSNINVGYTRWDRENAQKWEENGKKRPTSVQRTKERKAKEKMPKTEGKLKQERGKRRRMPQTGRI